MRAAVLDRFPQMFDALQAVGCRDECNRAANHPEIIMPDMPDSETKRFEPKKVSGRRWRFQYSLRTLMIVVSVCGVLSGWVGMMLERAREQRAVVKKIKALGGSVYYDYQITEGQWGYHPANTPPGPGWVRWILGDDIFAYATAVFFNSTQSTVKDNDLVLLRKLPRINAVILASPSITDNGLAIVGSLPELSELNLSDTSVTGEGLAQLEKARKLEHLTLDGASVGDSTIAHIDKLSNLQSLQLVRTSITDDGLRPVAGLSRLCWLDLFQNGGLTFKALKSIEKLTSLESLHIRGNSAIDRDFDRLAVLHKLKLLKIVSCSFHDEDMKIMHELTELTVLELSGTSITDDALIQLRSLTKLQDLNLSSTKIGNQGLAHLKPLTNLRYLNLLWTKIDKDGLAELECLSNLNILEVGPGLTKSDLLGLQKAVPECNFQFINKRGEVDCLGPEGKQ